VLLSTKIFSAPCCNQAGGVSALITADEAAKISLAAGLGSFGSEAQASGEITERSSSETKQMLTLSYSRILSDRLQAGASLPLVHRMRTDAGQEYAATSIGDVKAVLGYEFLPEFQYSSWRPRGYLYAQMSFPT